jgi:hypothetical protein
MASRLRTVCKRGHALKPPNILVHGGVRRCRQCYVDRKRAGRPEWITIDGVKMSVVAHDKFAMDRHAALRRAMVAAHPDKPGGTSSKFREAKRRIDRFMSDESKWYDKAGLAPPWAARSAVVTH